MTDQHYWARYVTRIRRRQLLAGSLAATAGGAALLLAGCGGDAGGSKGGAASNLHVPVDTTKQAKRGGTYRDVRTGGFEHFDSLLSSAGGPDSIGSYAYSRLLKINPGHLEDSALVSEGDLAEAFELSGDGLQISMKLRPNAKWDQRAPTNSRTVDSQDVVFSWDKFAAVHNQRGNLSNAASPDGVVTAINAIDKSTVVVKLARQDSGILTDLANTFFYIQPREAASAFDPKLEARGSGAWYVDKYEPSVGIVYRRNPNWYISDRPFIDRWEAPEVPEYVARLAQFRAGNIYTTSVTKDDLLPTKKDVPDLLLSQNSEWNLQYWAWHFSWSKGTIYEDDRIRKAVSMALDRELTLDTFSNAANLAAEGLEVQKRWNSHIPAGYSGWWLDPQKDEVGPGSKFFKYDKAEAKKLLAAAGYTNGFDVPITTSNHNTYQGGMNEMLVHIDMLNEVGVKGKFRVVDHLTDFRDNYQQKLDGDFPGIITIAQAGGTAGARGSFLRNFLLPGGGINHGFYAKGNFQQGDPEVTKIVNAIRVEFDEKKQAALAKELQKQMANHMYYVPWPGVTRDFGLSWPVIGNYNVYRHGGRGATAYQTSATYWWIDDTKPPLKKPA